MIRRLFLSAGLVLGLAVGCLGIGFSPDLAQAQVTDRLNFHGHYVVVCRRQDGTVRWREEVHNVVTTVGKNLMLDTAFNGSAYTAVGPFAGLISGDSFTGVSATDTMSSHAGWLEAGGANQPAYLTSRRTVLFGGAASGMITTSSPFSFSITGTGSIIGIFLVYGPGASATFDNTGGTMYSASVFPISHAVFPFDTVNVDYTTGM